MERYNPIVIEIHQFINIGAESDMVEEWDIIIIIYKISNWKRLDLNNGILLHEPVTMASADGNLCYDWYSVELNAPVVL